MAYKLAAWFVAKSSGLKGSVSLVLCLPENIKIQEKALFQLNIKENQSH
jgi:hypothetical protein